ncbi:MAG TPA: hypothetical protein VL984_05555 [Acidimicrobiales bacterium]|nr:hypothetical protein [Acidimicrobiales bacterium]
MASAQRPLLEDPRIRLGVVVQPGTARLVVVAEPGLGLPGARRPGTTGATHISKLPRAA